MTNLLFVLCLLPIFILFLKAKGLLALNAFWFAVFHLVAFALIGYAFPAAGTSDSAHLAAMTVGALAFYGFLAGYFLAPINRRAASTSAIGSIDIHSFIGGPVLRWAIVMLMAFTAVAGLLYFGGLPPVLASATSLLGGELNSESALAVRDFRFAMTKSAYFGSEYRGQGLFRALTFTGCAIIVSYFAFLLAANRDRGATIYFSLSLCFAFVFVGGVGDRAPFIEILMVATGAYSLSKPLKIRHVVRFIFIVLLALLFLSALSTKGSQTLSNEGLSGIFTLTDSLVERLFRGNSQYDIVVIDLVNSGIWPLRLGDAHLRNIVTAIPGVNYGVPVSHELFVYLNPLSNRSTFLSGTYMTHAYLDFGLIGAPLIYLVSGLFIGLASKYVERRASRSQIYFLTLPTFNFLFGKIFIYGLPGFLPSLATLLILVGLLKVVVALSPYRVKKLRRAV